MMKMLQGHTPPEKCLLAICLPLTMEQFIKDIEDPAKDYAKIREQKYNGALSPEALWENDHKQLADLIKKVADEMRSLGVAVIENFTLQHIDQITPYYVVTLVAHWDDARAMVELADGLTEAALLASRIPQKYQGILDLTVCNSVHLQDEIKIVQRRTNVVIANTQLTDPVLRIILYRHTMRMLAATDKNYVDAMNELRLELLNNY